MELKSYVITLTMASREKQEVLPTGDEVADIIEQAFPEELFVEVGQVQGQELGHMLTVAGREFAGVVATALEPKMEVQMREQLNMRQQQRVIRDMESALEAEPEQEKEASTPGAPLQKKKRGPTVH